MRFVVKIIIEEDLQEDAVGAIVLTEMIDSAKKIVLGATKISMSPGTFKVFNRIVTRYQFNMKAEKYKLNKFRDLTIEVLDAEESNTITVA